MASPSGKRYIDSAIQVKKEIKEVVSHYGGDPIDIKIIDS